PRNTDDARSLAPEWRQDTVADADDRDRPPMRTSAATDDDRTPGRDNICIEGIERGGRLDHTDATSNKISSEGVGCAGNESTGNGQTISGPERAIGRVAR